MCPQAQGAYQAPVKYAWMDHDPPYILIAPPTINVWYTLYHDYDVRQLLMAVLQHNDEEANQDIEVRWVCDGNTYLWASSLTEGSQKYLYKTKYNKLNADTLLVDTIDGNDNPSYRDKRALDFKVDIRITSAVTASQTLEAYALYETLEVT
jgi:hypothetical protein